MQSPLFDIELLYWLYDSDYQERKAIEFHDICAYLKVPTVDLSFLWSNMDPLHADLVNCCLSLYVLSFIHSYHPIEKATSPSPTLGTECLPKDGKTFVSFIKSDGLYWNQRLLQPPRQHQASG